MKGNYLKINKACSEQWEHMKPNEKGSFCDTCSKNVIDFTQLSQSEITKKVKNTNGNICARLTKKQLETPLVDFEIQKKYRLPYANAAASLLIASTLAIGQTACVDNANVQTEFVQTTNATSKSDSKQSKSKPNTTSPGGFITFKGKVVSENNGIPIANAKITFVSVQKMFTTNSLVDGSFSLEIPTKFIDNDNVVRVSYEKVEIKNEDKTGDAIFFPYETTDYILSKAAINSAYKIEAKPEAIYLGGIGYYPQDLKPIVIDNQKRINYEDFMKARHGKKSSCSLENKDYHYFTSKSAMAIYGEEAKEGLYILIDKSTK